MLATLGAIALLLILSAFFSGSETALTAASRPLMHQREQEGDARAATVNKLHDRKERLIGTILLGNNLVNIMASALATSLLIANFGEAGVAYATIAMTLLVLIFAEILPKTYAIRHADQMALGISSIVDFLVTVMAPFTAAIDLIVRVLLKIFGIDRDTVSLDRAEAELRGAIELHDGEDDSIVRHERAMLRSVLDLGDVQVSEIMTHRKNVTAVDVNLPAPELVDEVLDSPFTRIPLWKNDPDEIVGVLHAKALLREVRGRGDDISDIDVAALAADPWFIPEQTPLLDQLEAFRNRREHFALVVDEYGSLMGVVTLEDILEEIVGDIDDEHDEQVGGVLSNIDGTYTVEGDVTIRDLNREYEWGLPDEEAATIAGLVLHEARRIPDVGQSFMFHGFRFDIEGRHRNQITRLKVTPPVEPSEP